MRRPVVLFATVLTLAGVLTVVPGTTAIGEDPVTLVSDPPSGDTGTTITVSGQGCYLPDGITGADGLLYRLIGPDGRSAASATIAVGRDGTWNGPFVVPPSLAAGDYAVQGTCIAPMYEDLGVVDGGTFTVTGSGPAPRATEAAPPTPTFPGQIEPYPAYDGQSNCSPNAKPGMVAFRDMVMAAYPQTSSFGISRDCGIGGTSEHKEGRAWDWAVNAGSTADRQRVDELMGWLLATDQYGNRHAMARRLGVMYIIWNRRIFKLYRAGDGWTAYSGSSPHTDHVHVSLTRAGGQKTTSFWTQQLPGPTPGPGGFYDVPANAWYGPALEWGVAAAVVTGFPDQTYRPKEPVNRGQAAAWIWEQAGRPEPASAHAFSDVPAGAWYGPALSWATETGVVTGFPDGTYRPQNPVNRGQFAAMLWNYAERPRPPAPHAFGDVSGEAWFADAVSWATAMRYVSGFPDSTFVPKDPVNRAQGVSWLWGARQFADVPLRAWYAAGVNWGRFRSVLIGDEAHAYQPQGATSRLAAVIALWRAMDRPAPTAAHGFSDVTPTGPDADAVAWAVGAGVVTGYPDGTFRPTVVLNRAQAVMILWRATGQVAPTTAHAFTDVASGAWYADGLSWATEHGVVRGFADGTFRPAEPVNRGQLAAYLRGIASTPTAWTPGATPPGTVLF